MARHKLKWRWPDWILLPALCLLAACAYAAGTAPPTAPAQIAIQGRVVDAGGSAIPGALVRVKATQRYTLSDDQGGFLLEDLEEGRAVKLTAWAPGYYIGGGGEVPPGTKDVKITLVRHHDSDNQDYAWLPSTYHPGEGEDQGCARCHSRAGTDLVVPLPVDEWLLDAHAGSARNQRFLTMYSGTDTAGNQSPPTRYGYNRDYGSFPLLPDPGQPYYGPGYLVDFPGSRGNCAACHTPLAAVDDAYGVDPTGLSGVDAEGISCDFCHKVWDVKLDPASGLPDPNMPGVLSFDFRRPPEGHQFFAGPLDDVAPGEDTYTPVQQQSSFCAPCHYGVFWDTVVYNSYGEWLESPYSDPQAGKTCQDCHMPPTGAALFALPEQGGEVRDPRTVFSHRMPGAADEALLQNTLSMSAQAWWENGELVVEVAIINDQAGHHVPTDSPLRQVILLVQARDAGGQALALVEGPALPGWAGMGDPGEGYYAGLPGRGYARILRERWTGAQPSGAYWNPTEVVSDTRLAAFQQDTSRYTFADERGGAVSVEVRLLFRRAFIQLVDQKDWQGIPDILMEQSLITIPALP